MRYVRAATSALALTAAACTLLAARFALASATADGAPADDAVSPLAATSVPTPAPPDSLARTFAARDPFRLARAPASARFDPVANMPGALPPPTPPRPTLSLAGIIMGAEPSALIEGIPGSEGPRLLRLGERAGNLLVRQITPDRVIIAARDTTWTLRVRNRYQ